MERVVRMERLDRYIRILRRKRLERDLRSIGLEWVVWMERYKWLLRILGRIRALWH